MKAFGLTMILLVLSLLLSLPGLPAAVIHSTQSTWQSAAPPVPKFKAPSSRSAWESQRLKIRTKLWELLGRLPPRPGIPAVRTVSREDQGDYWLEKFEFDNGVGATVPGFLLLPKGTSGKVPAILYCHWHGGDYDKGKVELFERLHMPEEPGPALVRLGFAVMAVDAYCFGERNGRGPGSDEKGGAGELTASEYDLWLGRTLWGMILRDDLMALDYLVSRPEVDGRRIGVTGISMGATRSWWLMALDERIKAGVAVACLTRYQNLIAREGLKYHGIYYYVPGMLSHFDTEAVVALAAPRPLLVMNGDQDDGSPIDGILEIESRVKGVYTLYGLANHFRSEIYSGVGHVYLPEMWRETKAWFEVHLKPER